MIAVSAFFVNAGRWQGLNDALLQLPVIGSIYEALFRRESYYRIDARLMYLDVVNQIVRTKVQEFTAAGGVPKAPFKEVSDPQQPMGFKELAVSFVVDQLEQIEARSRG